MAFVYFLAKILHKCYIECKEKEGAKGMECETCYYYDYDEEFDCFVCLMQIDQDDMARVMERHSRCPYYRQGDDYYLATRQ